MNSPSKITLLPNGLKVITLSNGKRVGNFSSPHSFTFEDGSILPEVSPEEAERLKAVFYENPVSDEFARMGDTMLEFELSAAIYSEMGKWIAAYDKKDVDVVFIPLPMMTAMRREIMLTSIIKWPFRTIRIEDRLNKLVSISKQCI